MATRAKVTALNQSPAVVKKAAAAEKARKAASKAALHAALDPTPDASDPVLTQANSPAPTKPEPDRTSDNERAVRAEMAATGMSLEEACESMGVDPKTFKPAVAKTPYSGPMLALKTARNAYVKAPNGILCNGSPLALLCGQYKREVVVSALVEALALGSNPYTHLNPGQQSMNLRNKARYAMQNGMLTLAHVEACLKARA